MTHEQILSLIKDACNKLINNDSDLFKIEVNERSLTHRLAVYLENLFPEWKVDCEYNKLGDDAKKIHVPCEYEENGRTDNLNGRTVYPDIIIHKRGKLGRENNLIVIEAKKSNNEAGREKDVCKLGAYKKDPNYGYQFAFFIDFITGNNPQCNISIMNEDGKLQKI